MSSVQEVREALESVLAQGSGKVSIAVHRAGLEPVCACVDPLVWGALHDALAPEPRRGRGEEEEDEG